VERFERTRPGILAAPGSFPISREFPDADQEDHHMSERALRGSRLGAQSYESDAGVEAAPRRDVAYDCPAGHQFTMPFSVEAEIPAVWECRVCGAEALLVDGDQPEPKKTKPARTHWDMLMERRSIAELEVLLDERLALLRSGTVPARTGQPETRKSA
jgi:rubredoxin